MAEDTGESDGETQKEKSKYVGVQIPATPEVLQKKNVFNNYN
jgi:hypothetical protein